MNPPKGSFNPKYFGYEEQNQWCYYFEKADLSCQLQDWDNVVALYDQARNAGFQPRTIPEWVPLMEAYLQTNQIDKAVEISISITASTPTETASLCKLLTRMDSEVAVSAEEEGKITDMSQSLQCAEE